MLASTQEQPSAPKEEIRAVATEETLARYVALSLAEEELLEPGKQAFAAFTMKPKLVAAI